MDVLYFNNNNAKSLENFFSKLKFGETAESLI